jgi:RNA polymerase sigma factor (sigma-70 family)
MTCPEPEGAAWVEQLQSPHPRWDKDKEVCERLTAGDEAALGELYDEFSPLVYGLAARVTRDWAAAEDITQEVFVRVWEAPQAFDPARGTWMGWLCTMTHRRAVDWVRRSAARHRHSAAAAPPVAAPDPEETAVAGSVAKSVQVAVNDLPEAQREVIRLAYFDGQTYRQVAETLGIPEGTAKSRLWTGLRRLADRMQAEGIEP